MDTSGAKIWLPGISDTQALEAASILCGTAAVREHGQNHHTRHPVLTPEMIRQLPARHALVIRSGHSPVIAQLPMAWNDHAYRRPSTPGAQRRASHQRPAGSARRPGTCPAIPGQTLPPSPQRPTSPRIRSDVTPGMCEP